MIDTVLLRQNIAGPFVIIFIIVRYFVNTPRAGLEPPPEDDTSYEADALPTKPPRLVYANYKAMQVFS